MGLPKNSAEWTDLIVEGALLPKPGLHGPFGIQNSPAIQEKIQEKIQNPWIQSALNNPQLSESKAIF